jgi:hypothetical protein
MPAKDRSRRPGPPRKPRTATERRLALHESQTRAARRRVSGKDRRFVQLYVDRGFREPNEAALAAGFREPYIGEKLVLRLSELIESERVRRSMGEQMEVDEALSRVAELARTVDDPKTKHAALRTVLEVHGVLTGRAIVDRREQMRSIHQLVAAIREKIAKGGGKGKVKVRATERVLEAEIGGEEGNQTEGE